ncbi:MAG TPA: histidine kinase [Candidatus Acidoferrales bacterium]|nr:histidine kinase [Candidatus Acidoferrales bacterium]
MRERGGLLRIAGAAIVAAAGARALYAAIFAPRLFAPVPHAPVWWAVLYACFAVLYALAPQDVRSTGLRRRLLLVAGQSLAAVLLVLLYPDFIVTCLLVVVAWQIALTWGLRTAAIAIIAQSAIIALEKCAEPTALQSDAMSWIVFGASLGFQIFAICTAELLKSETEARTELARAHAELTAAQVLLGETAAVNERLRISRDLHDAVGHNLTVLAIQTDVAIRMADGPMVEQLTRLRAISSELLEQVRVVVAAVREEPVNVRGAIAALTANTGDLTVTCSIPDDLRVGDAAAAEALIRCVQELVTNALRHANAAVLRIEIRQTANEIVVDAADDGRGGSFVEGRGLAGMRERFAQLGGALSIDSTSGFHLLATMPTSSR